MGIPTLSVAGTILRAGGLDRIKRRKHAEPCVSFCFSCGCRLSGCLEPLQPCFPTRTDQTFTCEPDKTSPLKLYLSQQWGKELRQLETWPSHLRQNKGRKEAL